jgi:putative endonuclease
MAEAIKREKQIKEWLRGWKIELIEKMNPVWRDLYEETCGLGDPAKFVKQ